MVEIGVYAVDWTDLTARLAEFAQLGEIEGWDAFLDAIDESEVDLPYTSARTQFQIYGTASVYASFATAWDAPSREPFEAFCDAFFWTVAEHGERIYDLAEDWAYRFHLDLAWSPTTVHRFAELWGQVDVETARAPYAACAGEAPLSFDAWSSLIRAHGDVVTRAAGEGRGLIEVIFG